ncbi:MAG TPA: hypothetical protein IAB26_06710 [Candidatus Limivivens merdigallinarum]|uniref:Nucleic acid binding OB-fold tRNA/helicase-type n=1 Tax=Candidatus Limivivens merdigallinarum TaxID=2840859 RepID=A0A9D0ZUQ9_9FIRM|nr:hypothetical protein [Candidatus Limivivens merdigallinarum]
MKKSVALFLTLSLTAALSGSALASETETETEVATEAAAETEGTETEAAKEDTADAETEASEDASESESAEEKSEGVMTYAEYMDAAIDDEVVIETYVQAKQSWWEDKATLYTQDRDGAYFIYDAACSEEDYEKLVPGTKIKVTGYKAEWSGEIEVMDGTVEIVEGGDEYIAPITDVTDLLGTDELIDHQNEYVEFKGLTVEAAGQDEDGNDVAFLYNYDGSGTDGDDLYFNASLNGETYTFTIESYLCDNTTDVYAAVKNLEIGQTIDMEGFLYWYEGVNPHITSVTVVE